MSCPAIPSVCMMSILHFLGKEGTCMYNTCTIQIILMLLYHSVGKGGGGRNSIRSMICTSTYKYMYSTYVGIIVFMYLYLYLCMYIQQYILYSVRRTIHNIYI